MSVPVAKPYIAEFEKMGFGMFIHWGLYSQLGQGEWVLSHNGLPEAQYQKLKETFTAEDFDAEKIVLMAKNAGCKYIVLTARHHEGFSLYDTCGLSDFDAPHSPTGRDLVREFVDACNEAGIIPFFYHTCFDWYQEKLHLDKIGRTTEISFRDQPDYEKYFNTGEYFTFWKKSIELFCTR